MKPLSFTKNQVDPKSMEAEVLRISEIFRSLGATALFLFGSAIDGSFTDQSDLDFLIVMESEEGIRRAQRELRPYRPIASIPTDLVWLTRSEFQRKKSLGGVAMIVAQEGRCLFGKEVL